MGYARAKKAKIKVCRTRSPGSLPPKNLSVQLWPEAQSQKLQTQLKKSSQVGNRTDGLNTWRNEACTWCPYGLLFRSTRALVTYSDIKALPDQISCNFSFTTIAAPAIGMK